MRNVTYISAGAGSGKTYTLTTKLAELISKDKDDPQHVEPEQVILTTFTVKAANEFKEKAKAELYKLGKFDEASRLDHALMGTIDSVASTLIQKYWFTVGLSPKQGVMDDDAKLIYINQSIANIPTDDDLHFFARFRKAFGIVDGESHPDENFWKEHLKSIVEKSISFDIDDYADSIGQSLQILKSICTGQPASIGLKEREYVLEKWMEEVDMSKASKTKTATMTAIDSLKRRSRYMEDIEWFAEFANIMEKAPAVAKGAPEIPELEEAKQVATDLWRSQDVYDMQEQYIRTIFRLAKEWNEQYTQYKRNKRVVDFSDIEHYMHKLLQDKEVATEIGRTYTHLFVDEFQDCSPIQVKIFMTLADVVKQSYWVGDTKQAIYGFRGSDTQLTKAVADSISAKNGQDGCLSNTLEKSWRSVPDLVHMVNTAFLKIFEPMFKENVESQVRLEPAMELHPENFNVKLEDRPKHPLRYLDIKEKRSVKSPKLKVTDVAQYIKNVIEHEKVNLSDIAVLGRTGNSLNDVQMALTELRIPCDREASLDKGSKACQLMIALTTLTANPHDDLAKAVIAHLTQEGMGVGALIDSKLEYNNTPKEERHPWLSSAEMIRRVDELRPRVMYQGIGALMETLAVELDVKNIMEQWDTPAEQSMADVKTLILVAKQYEQRSSDMAQPATPSGFVDYLDANEWKVPVSGNGVQLLTYHGAKGLEWKYVFLLLDGTLDQKEMLRREFYGCHHFHPEIPTADNPYPKMCIRLLPWIFSSKKNVPDNIADIFFATEKFENLKNHEIMESARLMYVGMTRAAEVLVLVPWLAKKEFDWLKHMGLEEAGNIEGGDVLGIGTPFHIVKAEFPAEGEAGTEPMEDEKTYRKLDYRSDCPSDAPMRVVAPSGRAGKADKVKVVLRSEQFIKINGTKLHGREYAEVGNCIHNVYAAIEQLDEQQVADLICQHEMGDVLPNAGEVVRAWTNLQDFLSKQYGDPVATYHERPFRQLRTDGTIVVGSIDYVYRTTEGDVLIDFKTFPQVEAITDPTSPHYAGHYAGQLDAYTEALKAAGEKVLRRYIYYPVSGLLVEVGESSEAPATDNGNKKKKVATTNQVIFSSTKTPDT